MTYDLRTERVIEAEPTAVLEGFLDMYRTSRPAWIHRSELDLRVGGSWAVDFGPPGPPAFHEERVITAWVPGRRLAYSVTATYPEAPPLHTEVEIDCEALADGNRTRVTLSQRLFPTAEQRDEFLNAWHDVLVRLKSTLENGG